MNWSRPSGSTTEPGLGDQNTLEMYLRIQRARHRAITPDVQLIINPARAPARDSVFVAGLRLRLAI
jgi:carbohydrate-selective porin OprB